MTDRQRESEQEARHTLETLRHDRDALGGLFARWFAPRAAPTDDPVEMWGARIGRSLSLIAVIAICLYLFVVYVR